MARATKLTITIPFELADRLAPYRDELNLSRIASSAIEQELQELEWRDEQAKQDREVREGWDRELQEVRAEHQELVVMKAELVEAAALGEVEEVDAEERLKEIEDLSEQYDRLENKILALYHRQWKRKPGSGKPLDHVEAILATKDRQGE